MPAKFAGSSTEGVADHGRRKSQRIFFDFIYLTGDIKVGLLVGGQKNKGLKIWGFTRKTPIFKPP